MESCWCYEAEFEFRSLMAWGKKLLLSLLYFWARFNLTGSYALITVKLIIEYAMKLIT